MRFELIDRVVERSADRIVAVKQVSAAEEYLQDHFPGFPVLPGVMMLEAMVQAARLLLEPRRGPADPPLVLGRIRALKFGQFVKPGMTLVVEVALAGEEEGEEGGKGGRFDLRGEARVQEPPGAATGAGRAGAGGAGAPGLVAASGRFTMRPARLTPVSLGAARHAP